MIPKSRLPQFVTILFLLATLSFLLRQLPFPSNAAESSCPMPSFAAVVTPAFGVGLFSLAAGDLNGDGKPDIVTGDHFADKVHILFGDGAGNFSVTNSVAVIRPVAVVLGDFNQDTKLDLAVTVGFSSMFFDPWTPTFSTTISIYLGTGSGTFLSPTNFTVGKDPFLLVIGDFNNDAKPDLATGNDGSSTISILLGNGDGSFTAAPTIANVRPSSLVAADFNHDNRLDLAATDIANNKVTVWLGNGTGGFGAATQLDGGSESHDIAAADFNGDTHADLVVTNFSDCCSPAFVAVLLGDGSGSFGSPTKFSVPFGPASLAVADFNGDGKADVATGNVQETSRNIAVLLGDGTGALGSPTIFVVGAPSYALLVHDLNLDGVPDLIATSTPRIATLLNACGGAPTPTPTPTPSPTPVASPTPLRGDVVISQIYSGGGQPGSTFQYNYVELFNRTNETIDINGWPISGASATGSSGFAVGFVGSNRVAIGAGRYLLIQLGPSNTNGAPLPVTPDFTLNQNIQLSGRMAFSQAGTFLSGSCPILPNPNIIDYVGFGSSSCFEGAGAVANLSFTTAALRLANGCTDTDNNAADFVVGPPSPRNSLTTPHFCSSDPPKVQFTQSVYHGSESSSSIGLYVGRTGNTSAATTVDYATSDAAGASNCNVANGKASARCDYITRIGTLQFEPYETYKFILLPIINDAYAEGAETFNITLSNVNGATLGVRAAATISLQDNDSSNGINPIDNTGSFVRQQYLDFLNREPDPGGEGFWNSQINNCTPKPQCTEVRRINVSAAFFLSIEFQESGYLAYRAYKSAYGDAAGQAMIQGLLFQIPVPMVTLTEFQADSQAIGHNVIVGATNWQQQLESNKVAYFETFVGRPRFLNEYPAGMNAGAFVSKLNMNAGNVLSTAERDELVNQLQSGQKTRAQIVRAVAEDSDLATNERNRAFVLMQYFGYLRRNPNDAPEPTLDFTGYNFWLTKLNQFNGNYIAAELVKAFISSSEYRQRFGS